MVKKLPANTGDIRDAGSVPGLGRSLEKIPMENPMDREPIALRIAKSRA